MEHEDLDELEEHFQYRTNRHLSLVKKYLNKVNEWIPNIFTPEMLQEEKDIHDQGKWMEPEYTPYLHLTWKYKLAGEGKKYDPPEEMIPRMHEATFHHIKHHKHHPEFWDENVTIESLNANNRDAPSGKIVDGTKMPLPYVASMMADWCAMTEEKKSDIQKWIKNNVNVRWSFTEEQVKLITDAGNRMSEYVEGGYSESRR
jgi:hypothetical protein